MIPDLAEARAQLLAQRDLPEGYRIEVDGRTNSILVCGPSLAFCATCEAIQDGRYKLEYAANLDALIQCEKEVLLASYE